MPYMLARESYMGSLWAIKAPTYLHGRLEPVSRCRLC